MTRRLIWFLSMILLITASSMLIQSCNEAPNEPDWNNPVDPENPETEGDPYKLQINLDNGGVTLSWQAIQGLAITGYNIYRKVNNGEFALLVRHGSSTTYTDADIQNGNLYEYYVVARTATAEASRSNIVSQNIYTDPVIVIEGGIESTPVRSVSLTLIAFGAERMMLSNTLDFNSSVWEEYASEKQWQLHEGAGIKNVYMKVTYSDNDTSAVVSDGINPAEILGSVSINNNDIATANNSVTLLLSAVGASEMIVSNETVADEADSWISYAESMDWNLSTGAEMKTVYVRFRNDFLMVEDVNNSIEPLLAFAAGLSISDDADTIQTNNVRIALEAEYTDSMMISADEEFTDAIWVPYQQYFQWDLGTGQFNGDEWLARFARSVKPERKATLALMNPKNTELKSKTPGTSGRRAVRRIQDRKTPTTLSRDATRHQIFAKVNNSFDVPSSPVSDNVVVEIAASVSINNGQDSTASRQVQISLNAPEADDYAISNDSLDLVNNPDWQVMLNNIDWVLDTGPGVKTVYVRFRNNSGAESGIISDAISPLPMELSIDLDNGALFALDIQSELAISATGINLEMMISNDSEFVGGEWQAFREDVEWTLLTGADVKTVWVKVRNVFEIEETVSDAIEPRLAITRDLVISQGADTVQTNLVQIQLTAQYADSMQVSNRDDFAGAEWVPWQEDFQWDLGAGSIVGASSSKRSNRALKSFTTPRRDAVSHELFARVDNSFAVPSDHLTDAITVEIFGTVTINRDEASTSTPYVTVLIDAEQAEFFAISNDSMMVVEDPQWLEYEPEIDWRLQSGIGTKQVFVRFRNSSGAESQVYSDSIEPVSMNPTFTIEGSESGFTPARLVNLNSTVANDSIRMKVSEDSLFDGVDWVEFNAVLPFELSLGEAQKTVYCVFKDLFEITSDTLSDSISPLPMNAAISIDAGVDSTMSFEVEVTLNAEGDNILYWLSNTDDQFEGEGTVYVPEDNIVSWQLEPDQAEMQVFARFINDFEVEALPDDAIRPAGFGEIGVDINNDDQYTATREVIVFPRVEGYGDNDDLDIRVCLSEEDLNDTEWVEYDESIQLQLETGEGAQSVFAQFRNIFGIESEVVSDDIEPLPMDVTMEIVDEDDDGFTPARLVELLLSAQGENLRMKLSEDAGFQDVGWEDFAESPQFELSVGTGEKTVYVVIINDFDIQSDVVQDAISPLPIEPEIIVENGSEFTPVREVNVTLYAEGLIDSMQVSVYEDFHNAEWIDFAEETTVNLLPGGDADDERIVYARFANDFEIVSEVISDDILPLPMREQFDIVDQNGYTTVRLIELILRAQGANLRMMISEDQEFTDLDWVEFAESAQFELSTGGEQKTIYAKYINDFEIESIVLNHRVTPLPMEPVVEIEGGAEFTADREVTVALLAQGEIDSMQISIYEDFNDVEWVDYSEEVVINLLPGGTEEDERIVYARFANDFDIVSAIVNDAILPLPIAPSVEIVDADGDGFTPARLVTLYLTAIGSNLQRMTSEDEEFEDGGLGDTEWIDYDETQEFELSTGGGEKSVYVRFVNDFEIESEVVSDLIAPLPMEPSIRIDDEDGFTAHRLVNLSLSARGDNLQMMLADDSEFNGVDWEEYGEARQFELSAGAGDKIVFAKFLNDFEVESEIISNTITPQPLNANIIINDNQEITNDLNLTLSMPDVGALEMQVSTDRNFADAAWSEYTDELDFILNEGDGARTVFARFQHEFFVSETASDMIIIDTRAEIQSFTWSSAEGNPHFAEDAINFELILSNDAVGSETGGTATVRIQGINAEIMLEDAGGGRYSGDYIILAGDFVNRGGISVSFVDRVGNEDNATANTTIDIHAHPHDWAYSRTDHGHSILIRDGDIDGDVLENHDEVGVFTPDGICAGVAYIDDRVFPAGFTAWGDDPETQEIDGLRADEIMSFRIWDSGTNRTYDAEVIDIQEGDLHFQSDGVTVLSLRGTDLPDSWNYVRTDNSHVILIQDAVLNEQQLQPWDVIGVFTTDGLCAGRVFIEEDGFPVGLTAWGDDPATQEIDGFQEDERMIFRMWDNGNDEEFGAQSFDVQEGESQFQNDGATMLSLFGEMETGIEHEFLLVDNIYITMIWIPPGEFLMGSPDDEDERFETEGPVHNVTLLRGFWMGKYETTQGIWESVMGNNPPRNYGAYGVGEDYPVYYVSWDDIQDFEESFNDVYRLPSESEWEYACRAGSRTRFFWGDDADYENIDHYAVNLNNAPGGTAEVGTKEPNAFGLYDMSGNVMEWCEDRWHNDYEDAPDDGGPWLNNPANNTARVYRGGSWVDRVWSCRSAYRSRLNSDNREVAYGFRLVRDAD